MSARVHRRVAVWALGCALVACADDGSSGADAAPGERVDATARPDGGTPAPGQDASPRPAADAHTRDAAPRADAQSADAATRRDAAAARDAGATPRDAGGVDRGVDAPVDASPPPLDAAPPCVSPGDHEGAPLAAVDPCGRLTYGRYANRGEDDAVHRLPDFSYAGYRGGGVALPDAPTVVTLDAPSGRDDRARIQAALDEVAARPRGADGLRGAVLLRRGEWRVDGTLYLRASGVILRGEGQGARRTRILATRRQQHDLIVIEGARGLTEVDGTRQRITTDRVPVGSRSFRVRDAGDFAVGDVVGVLRTPNQRWIDALGMGRWGWTPDGYTIAHERRVTAIDGDRITVDAPLVDTLDARYGGGALFRANVSRRVEQVGVEDLRLVSAYDGREDEDHGWKAVRLSRATNSWVRRVTAQHFGYAAVSVEDDSSFNTVEDCASLAPVSQITGGRRYAFNLSSGTGNLFQRCFSEQGRHDFVSGARTTGPNVWLDCYAVDSHSDAGPHHRWATGLLFDNVAAPFLHVENRADSGTGHGWSGAQVLFWNGLAEGIRCDAPVGAMNWTIGTMGAQQEGQWRPDEPPGWWASDDAPVEPRSLYLQQLRDRLGPAAVRRVTTPAQRSGRIWGQLATWAGEGALADVEAAGGDPACAEGIARGVTCCSPACGACGGEGCGGRPGGSAACCSGAIGDSGRSCAVAGPPCVLDPDFTPL